MNLVGRNATPTTLDYTASRLKNAKCFQNEIGFGQVRIEGSRKAGR
jgi:hypothetical protein